MYNQGKLNHHILWYLIKDKLDNAFILFSLLDISKKFRPIFIVGKMSFFKKGESMTEGKDLHLTMTMEEVNLMKIL